METDMRLPARAADIRAALIALYGCAADRLQVYGKEEWTAPVASGSSAPRAMVVCPCTTGTLAAIACGTSDNLIDRAADVALKEGRPLILVVRETPFSVIHLENMLALARIGATILPANPGFYHRPETVNALVDFIVARVLDHLGVNHSLGPRWGQET
jgi:4-hydroxy-3-polyprenylbenzoate decarboxylase